MHPTTTAYGTWSGGRYMHFGEALDDDRLIALIRLAYEEGMRTFVTADTYGTGKADEMLGVALQPFDRDSYCLVGAVGHDIYDGVRAGAKGYQRFTDPELRDESGYAEYLERATRKQLERCGTDHLDLVLLHNPDSTGYTSRAVWDGMVALKDKGLTELIGIAPGPANGFTVDLIDCFEKFGEAIDWAMVILNPLEPWPGELVLPTAAGQGIRVMTRVVDYGGLFHGDVLPGHQFKEGDHRTYRPAGWVEHAHEKLGRMREIADGHGLTLLQLASQWNLAQPTVECVVPTFIQEVGEAAKQIEDKVRELASLPAELLLTHEEIEEIRAIGDNVGCMDLKGASTRYEDLEESFPDRWSMRPELLAIAQREGINPAW
jgi:aryl-alcohol dehydrogenase-like predicted oxidoreductase